MEKIFQETTIRSVVVNNRIINVFRKKIGSRCAELKRVKKKSGGFGVKRIINKWRDQTYDMKIFYHELDKYVIEKEKGKNEQWKNLWRMKQLSDRNSRKNLAKQRGAAII